VVIASEREEGAVCVLDPLRPTMLRAGAAAASVPAAGAVASAIPRRQPDGRSRGTGDVGAEGRLAVRSAVLLERSPDGKKAGVPLLMPRPDVLGRDGTFVGLRTYQSRVTFSRFLREHAQTEPEWELLAAKLTAHWRLGYNAAIE